MSTWHEPHFCERVDTKRKRRADAILGHYGLSPAQAINVFYAEVEEAGGLPFDLRPSETAELLADPHSWPIWRG